MEFKGYRIGNEDLILSNNRLSLIKISSVIILLIMEFKGYRIGNEDFNIIK
jgi:hypothetical protein